MLQAYGGDLKGRVWRFDLSDPDEGKWKVELIAELKDKPGNAQPITTGIRIEIDQTNNVDRYLFVGTGMLLDEQDRQRLHPGRRQDDQQRHQHAVRDQGWHADRGRAEAGEAGSVLASSIASMPVVSVSEREIMSHRYA